MQVMVKENGPQDLPFGEDILTLPEKYISYCR